jgi:predicted TIM-barrel fold metal-dependent hydrolase
VSATGVIDCDQHLFESRTLWADYADPNRRDQALQIVDDASGNAWLEWQGRRMVLADVTVPGETDEVGARLQQALAGQPPARPYDEALPAAYWQPAARLAELDRLGLDEAFLFPNYGLVWEHNLVNDLEATKTNMGAWNRWALEVAADGGGRLHPVAHLTLRDLDWLDRQLAALAAGGIRLAMIAPALVDGRPLSHPDLDRAWASFVEHDVAPVFHVANQQRPFDEAWYASDPEPTNPVLSSVFLWVPAALAISDLVVNGVLERRPELRLGVIELSAVWLPMFLMYLDGGVRFVTRLHGKAVADMPLAPSEYVRRQVRVAAFAYERPERLIERVGDLFMCCSDYPHSEGTAHPLDDYRALDDTTSDPAIAPGLYRDNAAWLLGRGNGA